MGRARVYAALASTRDFVDSTHYPAAQVAARDGSLKDAWDAVRADCDPKLKNYATYEHCLPFNVARAYDEARGIDGNIYFGKTNRALVSVKVGDNVGVAMIRDLRGTIERERADIGIFLTLTPPTKPMVAEAAGAGQCEVEGFSPVPRIQIVTIEDALALRDRAVRLPARRDGAFKKDKRETGSGQRSLGIWTGRLTLPENAPPEPKPATDLLQISLSNRARIPVALQVSTANSTKAQKKLYRNLLWRHHI